MLLLVVVEPGAWSRELGAGSLEVGAWRLEVGGMFGVKRYAYPNARTLNHRGIRSPRLGRRSARTGQRKESLLIVA